jgi:hypothetical protein
MGASTGGEYRLSSQLDRALGVQRQRHGKEAGVWRAENYLDLGEQIAVQGLEIA